MENLSNESFFKIPAGNCMLNLITETVEQGVKYVQS